MMRCYLYEGERLVYEGQGWGIIIDEGATGRKFVKGFVYGTHQECTVPYGGHAVTTEADRNEDTYSYGENCWEPATVGTPAVCSLCDKAVPDGVQALVLMQRWANQGDKV